MTGYNPQSDEFDVLGGNVMNYDQAKELRDSLDSKIRLRNTYVNSELYNQDIIVSDRTVEILCSSDYDASRDIFVTISVLFENESVDVIPEEYVLGWIDKGVNDGKILVQESNVESIFEETGTDFHTFKVEFAGINILTDFEDEINALGVDD